MGQWHPTLDGAMSYFADIYRGKRVLVTGVSAGLGVETARVLAAHGADLVLHGHAHEAMVAAVVAAVTVAFTISVSVCPTARLVLPTTVVLVPTCVGVPLLLLALIRLRPALSMSLIVTFCATLGPRFTSVTV